MKKRGLVSLLIVLFAACAPIGRPANSQQAQQAELGKQAELHAYFENMSYLLGFSARTDLENADSIESLQPKNEDLRTPAVNRLIVEDRRIAPEKSDLASAYKFAAEQGSREPLCDDVHLRELHDVAANYDEVAAAVHEAMLAAPALPNVKSDEDPWDAANMATYLRFDANSCEEAARAEGRLQQLQQAAPHNVTCQPLFGGGFSCTQY
jgi:hypothetical protein